MADDFQAGHLAQDQHCCSDVVRGQLPTLLRGFGVLLIVVGAVLILIGATDG
jgi:hypothetical protein